MKRTAILLLIALVACCSSYAKAPLGRVSVTLNDGSVVDGFCENMLRHERPIVKISPQPDGKKSVKYKAADIRELKYEIPGDTVVEYWYSVTYYHSQALMMKKVRQCGAVTLWTACIGGQELVGPQGMRWTERVKSCISFGPEMAGGIAWDLPHIISGRCKELPGYGDFVKEYKQSHQEVKDWTEIEPLIKMCVSYMDFIMRP